MINIKRYSGILTLAAITLFSSCSEWDDHFETDNNVSHATSNLYEALCQNSETSRFAELAASVGYDKVLSSSQTYTVFAPSNEALANLETSNENRDQPYRSLYQPYLYKHKGRGENAQRKDLSV